MSKTSWILSTMALAAALNPGVAQAQPQAAPVPPPAQPALTAAPTVNVVEAGNSSSSARGTGVIADVGFMYLTPTWKNNPAFTAEVQAGNGSVFQVNTNQTDFDFGYQVAPQLSLGVIGSNGLGFRTSWWGFARSASASVHLDPSTTSAFVAVTTASPLELSTDITNNSESATPADLNTSARLRMSVWDFEALRDIQGGQWDLLLSAGVRYAHIAQDYVAVANPPFGDSPGPIVAITSGHNFNGAGPTLALNGRWFIGSSALYLYTNARGSFLFGRSKQTAAEAEVGFEENESLIHTTNSDKTTMPVVEGGLGAGWSRTVSGMQVFVEAGLVGQCWFNAGNSSRSTASTFYDGVAAGAPTDDNLGLIGYSFRFGINY